MFARVAVWEPMPDDERQWVIDAMKTVPGVLSAYHLVDPATGNGLSVGFFDDDVDGEGVKARSRTRPSRSDGTLCHVRLLYPRPSTGLSDTVELRTLITTERDRAAGSPTQPTRSGPQTWQGGVDWHEERVVVL